MLVRSHKRSHVIGPCVALYKFVPVQATMVTLCKLGLQSPIMIGDVDGTCEMREKLHSALFSYFKFIEFSTWTVGGSDPNCT